jgi:AGZA family xanthine/uracil permease-like MFS transporter
MVETGLRAAGKSLYDVGLPAFAQSLAIHGMISLERGFIFSSMILASIGVFLIERQFFRAAWWSLAAALFSAVGIIHAYELTPGGVVSRFGLLAAPEFVVSYLLLFVLFLVVGWWERKNKSK